MTDGHKAGNSKRHTASPRECKFCGGTHVWETELCPAYRKKCSLCQKPNHFAKKCPKAKSVEAVAQRDDDSDGDEEEDDWINAIKPATSDKELRCKLIVENTTVVFQVDTGAMVNTHPAKYAPQDREPYQGGLVMWNGTTVKPLGRCQATVVNPRNRRCYKVSFVITGGGQRPLLGLQTSQLLKLVTIEENNMERVLAMSGSPTSAVDKFADIFEDKLGTLPGEIHLKVKPDTSPVMMPNRRTPISIRPRLKAKLDEMEASGIIATVTEPSPWVSQLVVAYKKSGDLRVCVDPKELNKALVRERFTIPVLEDQLHELGCSKLFSKADLSSAYWHIMLDEESSYLTTFQTCYGRYRWVRLPFGLNVSAEIFQRKLLEALRGLPRVICIADDVIIHGRDKEEHSENLRQFFQRCRDIGIKLSQEKLELAKREVTFMGHRVTSRGLQSDPEKVRAIGGMAEPKDVTELRRFLGSVNYLGKFIPHLSMTLHPLLNLLKKDVTWGWSSAQQRAFQEAKTLVTTAPTLAFYDPAKELTLENDASEHGLGAAMFQDGRPIAYASRQLSEAERRYAQIEKEMLAVSFGLSRFHHYTYGRDVRVISDHKPLEAIVKKQLPRAPKRLQNLLLQTQDYNFTVDYRPGKEIRVADALSRAPVEEAGVGETLHNVFYTPLSKDRLAEVRTATLADESLVALKNVILTGFPDSHSEMPSCIRAYYDYRDELTVQNGIVLRGERIIIPASMRKDIKQRVHAGHLGINSCVRRAREIIFWPGMSSEI